MRVNVYGEELTDRIEVVTKEVIEGEPDGVEGANKTTYTFYGIRFWLKFPNQDWWIHRKVDQELDDDSTAITFWGQSLEELESRFQSAIEELQKAGSNL